MGLISGIIMGMLVGIALMAGWRHMMRYRSAKRIAKAVDIKLLASLNRDDLKKICGDNYPEWISFPLYEQVKWLNKQLSKMWPFVADAATMVIRESVEPLLEDYRPPGITSLKFSKLSLGNVAPKIEGIRVQSLKKGQITMDIDFRWGGDPSIILAVEAALVASIPIQLKDLQVFTVVRVIFQLAEEIPCISAVVVALLSEPKPRIDYTLKAVGGSLTALPGISDMIDDTVNSIVTDMLQWPHRIVVPIGGIPIDISDLELKPQGKISLTICKANDLKNMEMLGKSDPYAVVYIRPLFKVKTKVVDNNLNPVWNQNFELIAEDKETQSLIFEVYDSDVAGQDKRLGIAKLPLIDLEPETAKEIDLRLLPSLDMLKIKDKKDRGTLTIKVMYHHFNKEEQYAALEEEKQAYTVFLHHKVMAFSKVICLFLVLSSFLVLHIAQAEDMVSNSFRQKIDCGSACIARCRLASRQKICHRACGTCCSRCNCVPPGTSGNEDVCPCYATMTTHGGRHKCP